MSNGKNSSESPKTLFLGIGALCLIAGSFLLSEDKKIEGWGTIITGIFAFISALKD